MYKLLNCSSPKWDLYLNKLPIHIQDIYYTCEYYKMYELNGDGIGKLFVYYDNDGKIALYPFMLNEIKGYDLEDKYYDIETAYGYGGPIVNCHDKKFIESFENCFVDYCKENNIVAEFIRFHPLIRNENIFDKSIEILHNRITVCLDLSKGKDRIWNEDIKSKNRNMIRKAKKNGLFVQESKDFETFKKIYNSTMNKVDADGYYYFDDRYYEEIQKNNNYILLNVKKDDLVIASAIFMGYGEYFHYHLAGSLKEYLKFAPNNLLLWEAIKYGQAKGYKKMHFGGGLTNSTEDNLFKFKSSFSREYTDFYIGKRIHNRKVYEYLINKWEEKNNQKARILLQYRAK
ncbi:Acetyltransferase (GNAT) domain-containing protein [Clostridium acidisoli DSM 12555]|uniref:Acetyltransferase (GNAT) domain-containing protein n=1 Tax=Clostridium acidisoli DSM 12555 TaxID=1121291 RepID=A0A1W1XHC3_9CLOT|nr:peptidoglycan bridge formation glycyltransferase FemA/FemB family protein [Clostridium acidisoli]SMC23227.1 Acetyltransferase (GNAT) domain-containing protein [Clostridium acidisoli DSM 12555]